MIIAVTAFRSTFGAGAVVLILVQLSTFRVCEIFRQYVPWHSVARSDPLTFAQPSRNLPTRDENHDVLAIRMTFAQPSRF